MGSRSPSSNACPRAASSRCRSASDAATTARPSWPDAAPRITRPSDGSKRWCAKPRPISRSELPGGPRPAGLPHRPISAPDVNAARRTAAVRPSPGFAGTTRRQPPGLSTVPPGPALARRSTTPHPDRFAHSAPIYDHTASEAHRKVGALNKSQLTSLVTAVFSTIGEALARGDNVSIADFGTFTPRTRAPARALLPALDQHSWPSSRFCLVRDAERR